MGPKNGGKLHNGADPILERCELLKVMNVFLLFVSFWFCFRFSLSFVLYCFFYSI